MSYTKTYTIWCDGKDCLEWIGQESSRVLAWKLAKENGWVSNGRNRQYCPKCKDNLKTYTVKKDPIGGMPLLVPNSMRFQDNTWRCPRCAFPVDDVLGSCSECGYEREDTGEDDAC